MNEDRKKTKFFSWNTLIAILAACAVSVASGIWLHGLPLSGKPEAGDVASVTVTRGEERVEVSNADDVQLLVNAAGLLSYRPFAGAEGEPTLSVIYHLNDGGTLTAEANGTSVWWRGKAYALKEPEIFLNIVEGIFLDRPEAS